jgi:hypothetical protein
MALFVIALPLLENSKFPSFLSVMVYILSSQFNPLSKNPMKNYPFSCSDIKLWPFKVIPGPGEKPMIVVQHKGEEKQFAAEEISSMVLIKMREIAEAYLGSTIKNVVVIVA